jgi:type I restriction enzyme S subunit
MNSDLPQAWAEIDLVTCADVLDNIRVPVNSDERSKRTGDIPYYGATGQVGWIDDFLFDEELLLIGEDGAPFFDKSKPIAYIVRGKSWVNNHAHVLRARSNVTSNQYLKHFFNWFNFHDYVNGTTRLKLTQGAMNRIPVRLAPVAEQQRIVGKLETLIAKLDLCQGRLPRIPVLLKRLRQSVLASACSGRLTADWRKQFAPTIKGAENLSDDIDLPEIPRTWQWVKLPETGEMNRGKSRHRPRNEPSLFGGPYPFIQTGDIAQSGGKITFHRQTYNAKGLEQSRIWPAGTVCITIAANIAESALLTYPACFPDSIVGIIAHPKMCMAEFIEYFIRVAKNDLSTFAPATAQKNINIAILSELSVPLPPLDEQQEIVRRVGALFALADKIENRYREAEQRVGHLSQSVLAKTFRGELVPTEAKLAEAEGRKFETAEHLLKNIQSAHRDGVDNRNGKRQPKSRAAAT